MKNVVLGILLAIAIALGLTQPLYAGMLLGGQAQSAPNTDVSPAHLYVVLSQPGVVGQARVYFGYNNQSGTLRRCSLNPAGQGTSGHITGPRYRVGCSLAGAVKVCYGYKIHANVDVRLRCIGLNSGLTQIGMHYTG